jgi:hypothetical protein
VYKDITDVICVSGLHELSEVCIMLLRLSFVCKCSTVLLSECHLTEYKKKYCIHSADQRVLMLLHLGFVLCLNKVQYLRILCSRDQRCLSAVVKRRQKHAQLGPLAKAYLAFPLLETKTVSETPCS